jgi:hypothetical protein
MWTLITWFLSPLSTSWVRFVRHGDEWIARVTWTPPTWVRWLGAVETYQEFASKTGIIWRNTATGRQAPASLQLEDKLWLANRESELRKERPAARGGREK